RALTWWNTIVETRGQAAAIAHPWEDFKKLLIEEYCSNDEIQKLKTEFWNYKMVSSDVDRYTARFHELARNKRQMAGRNFVVTTPDQGQVQHHYAGQHPKTANERLRPTSYECEEPNHFRRNCLRLKRATTSKENHPNPMLAIKGNLNQGNDRNQARGRAFAIVSICFDAVYSFISTNFLPLIDMKHSVMSLSYEIEIASGLKVETNKIVHGCIIELEEVHEERPKGNLKQLKTMKVDELKLEDIPVVRNFPNVLGLSSLPTGLIDLPMNDIPVVRNFPNVLGLSSLPTGLIDLPMNGRCP
nr:hypothetical protein [Tanacetum cinerariifolium]